MEVYTSSEYVKMLKDEVTEWDVKTTYIWYANFDWDKAYTNSDDKEKPIWKIKKIVENWNLIETFYANWDTWFNYIWENRDQLSYV